MLPGVLESKFPKRKHLGHLLRSTLVTLDQGPTLLQYDLILTNYTCCDPISK